jgi:transposase
MSSEYPAIKCFFSSLEDRISADNPIRFIDTFVATIALESLSFSIKTIKSEGHSSLDTKAFLKIYLYGYLKGLRSRKKPKSEAGILSQK